MADQMSNMDSDSVTIQRGLQACLSIFMLKQFIIEIFYNEVF